jgi:hypothetical protein
VRGSLGNKTKTLSQKYSTQRAGGVAQVAEYLSRKYEALGSNPSNIKKERGAFKDLSRNIRKEKYPT